MTSPPRDLAALQQKVWAGSIPLEIRLASAECRTYDDSDPYLIQAPRLSYLPFLLDRLHAFFAPSLIDPSVHPSRGWFTHEDILLKWHHPLGLLYDLYANATPASHQTPADDGDPEKPPGPIFPTPWKLVLHFSAPPPTLVPLDPAYKALHDAFINVVKEADFLRNGTAKAVMSLSKDASTTLWHAVQTLDLALYNPIYTRLTRPSGGPMRHLPLKIYLPSSPTGTTAEPIPEGEGSTPGLPPVAPGSMKVIQALVTPMYSSRQPQTLGTALNGVLPSVFQSRRTPLLAVPVLHGAVVPMGAALEELVRGAAYADGFLHVVVSMISE